MSNRNARRLAPVGVALTFALLSVSPATADPDAAAPPLVGEPGTVASPEDAWLDSADGLVVRPVGSTSVSAVRGAVADLVRTEVVAGRAVGGGFQRLELGEARPVEELEAIGAQLVADGIVSSAEPNHRVVALAGPDDPFYWRQWHLHSRWPAGGSAYGINVEEAWDRTLGSAEVVVAVLDTGGLPHPDISGRTVPGYDLISDPDRARDGDGWDDDPTDQGDWTNPNDCGVHPGRSSSWHGLHVAGTIGASTGNTLGVAGVDQAARIQHVRVLGRCGGNSADIAAAIRWAAGAAVPGTTANPTPAKVLNLSLGGSAPCPPAVQSAVDVAVDRGATVVVAAGNDGSDTAGFPADCKGVISVAATSPAGDRATYSNYGDWVDIAAPGGDGRPIFEGYGYVLSLFNNGTTGHDPSGWTYAYMGGTSMAAPHVSGVVSLMLSVAPDLVPADVLEILTVTAQPFAAGSDPSHRCSSDPSAVMPCGAGIVDAGAAVAAAVAPAAPTLVSKNGDLRVTLSWNAVEGSSSPVTYRLYRSTGSGCSASGTPLFTTTTATSRVDTGLTHGVTYRYCMTAADGAGNRSPLSNVRSVQAVDRTAPAAPTVMTSAGDGRIAVSWTRHSDPTGPVVYRLYRTTGSECSTGSTRVYTGTGLSLTDAGLSKSRSYRYCVTATDGAGNRSAVAPTSWATTPQPCNGHVLTGDWDRSGRSGQGWWCDGRTRLLTASGDLHEFSYGRPGDVPVIADWNGDGRDTLSVIRDGTWHVNNRLGGGSAERSFVYGRVTRGDVPIAGSWDRGSRDLPGIIRDREWHLRNSQSGGNATWAFVYGRLTRGDLPLWGDWNGDGRDTAGIVRDGTWHLRNSHSSGGADISYVYGRVLVGDHPVVGDWTGDGNDTPGIVRGDSWHLRNVHAAGPADQVVRLPRP